MLPATHQLASALHVIEVGARHMHLGGCHFPDLRFLICSGGLPPPDLLLMGRCRPPPSSPREPGARLARYSGLMNKHTPFSPHFARFFEGLLAFFEFTHRIWCNLVDQEQLPRSRRMPAPVEVLDILPTANQLASGLQVIQVGARHALLGAAAFQTSAFRFVLGVPRHPHAFFGWGVAASFHPSLGLRVQSWPLYPGLHRQSHAYSA